MPGDRDNIKTAVKKRGIRLVVATDAACEGLNLQTLGTLINVDLHWNPSRLDQRLGRIKRVGQSRRTVDMLNLVYHDTQPPMGAVFDGGSTGGRETLQLRPCQSR